MYIWIAANSIRSNVGGIGKVTTALLSTFLAPQLSSPRADLIIRNHKIYELEKIYSPQLRATVRFRGLDCDGADERPASCFDGANADARRSHARFDGANANAARSNAKLRLRLPPFQ